MQREQLISFLIEHTNTNKPVNTRPEIFSVAAAVRRDHQTLEKP